MVPFVVLSYGAGLTAIRWAPYLAGTALGLVPSTVVQVGIGASAGVFLAWATPLTVVPLLAAVWARTTGGAAAIVIAMTTRTIHI